VIVQGLFETPRAICVSPGEKIFAHLIFGTIAGGGAKPPLRVSMTTAPDDSNAVMHLAQIEAGTRSLRAAIRASGVKYKARPLDGIWATAPYLHNGSVPSLWELLQDPSDRIPSFSITRDFDPDNVGMKGGASGDFLFDTSQPGNSNQGHAFGTALSEYQKRALLEYLKTL
jgi:hypothetical protein